MKSDETNHVSAPALFDLSGRVVVITGGAGLLGRKHAQTVATAGGIPVLVDVRPEAAQSAARDVSSSFRCESFGLTVDITNRGQVQKMLDDILAKFRRVDALINNAANNPQVENQANQTWSRFENYPVDQWDADLSVGLTGAFLCSQVLGAEMARQKRGVIINVASFFSVVAPDQRVYRIPGLPEEQQPVKPVSYSVVKAGIIGLTKYLATYWADAGVRVNALSPGGVYNGQPDEFVRAVANLTPMGRMAMPDDFHGAILFLCSDASSYMTGMNLVIDGGRTVW